MRKRIFIMIPSLLFYHAPMHAQNTQGMQQTTVISNPAPPSPSPKTTITTTTIPVDVGPSDADQRLVNMVYSKFVNVSALTGTTLTVTAQNGVVTISGAVVSQSQADAAVEAARAIPFVKNVISNITVTTNPGLDKGPASNY